MNQTERNEYLETKWVGPGWMPIVRELDAQLSFIDPDYTIVQVKEKFGGLRYYIDSEKNSEEMYKLISIAEGRCWRVCESCGSTNSVTTDKNPEDGHYRVLTLCNKCLNWRYE